MRVGIFSALSSMGFTIIEVMIFLAVSGLTFLIAASFINGKEAQAEYSQGMNNATMQINTIINNVSNGDYQLPYGHSLNCTISSSGGPSVTEGSQAIAEPAVAGCTFIGKVLSPDYNNNPNAYYLYTIDGCQYLVDTSDQCSSKFSENTPTSLSQEQPNIVSFLSGSNYWQNGIVFKKMYYVLSHRWKRIGSFGFFAGLPSQNITSISQSGATPLFLEYFTGSSAQTKNDIISLGNTSPKGYPSVGGYIAMCFEGDSQSLRGEIKVGSENGQQLIAQAIMGQGVAAQCLS